ncbi:DNA primase large subunit [Punctularia strigosozonata HHB-11173 SS5]|uniref:DNA primase large subunit n=1 Tax=Punctularia strigosozonata (strain HHB-11173) TaxID=741275 RepID=UPI0004416EAD|nr:DNA primase large subunit [Punctularia strigosozonata HHB-11173 SS5]EIN07484.1 DNA primase large subunit [Punctularia strigosozonata HHB-11173 SS5]
MFSARERRNYGQVEVHNDPKRRYPYRLNFYDRPPLEDVTIEEFETFALDRLRVLAGIESSFVRNRTYDELKSVTSAHCKKYLPLAANTAKSVDTDAERRKDHIGHFVLRLAFCRSEELRRRFLKAETTLFRVRFDEDDSKERESFLKTKEMNWIDVTDEEKSMYRDQLMAACDFTKEKLAAERFVKVRWTRVPDLVEKRRVFLKQGMAWVPSSQQSSIVFQAFQSSLEEALKATSKHFSRLDEDTRIVPLLDNLSRGFLAGVPSEWSDATSNPSGDEIKAEMVDDLARKYFPMCMRHLHDELKKDRHLKHFGRLQYGLFLKVLGLSIDEAITFWRRSFSNMTDDKFNKEYKYNIRHSYGLEGKRANYPAKSCLQILQSQPSSQDSHGCPYRHFSPDNLQAALLAAYQTQGLSTSDMPEIMHAVKSGHYHVACTRVFEITHAAVGIKKGEGVGGGESVTHPNEYAARSRELEKAKAKEAEEIMLVE